MTVIVQNKIYCGIKRIWASRVQVGFKPELPSLVMAPQPVTWGGAGAWDDSQPTLPFPGKNPVHPGPVICPQVGGGGDWDKPRKKKC